MAVSLPIFPPFDVHADGNAGPRWQKWLGRLERLFTGMKMTVPKRKRTLLLHYASPKVDEIFDTLPDTGDDNDYATGGGHWGVLNTATPQKIDKNTASPQEKLTKHRHRNIFSDFP